MLYIINVKAPIYVLTSDKYLDALQPFAYLFNKYWSTAQQVIVGGFTRPKFQLPPNFTWHTIGKFEDYPVDKWSNALIKMLLELPHDVFGLMLEDYWLTQTVDCTAVQVAIDYMHQFSYVARFDLTGDRLNSGFAKPYGEAGHVKLLISDPESQYHCSLMCALWRRSHLLKIVVENETPWQIELEGTSRLRALKQYLIVLGTTKPPVKHTLAFRSGDNNKLLLDEIKPEDIKEMRQLGLLKTWE